MKIRLYILLFSLVVSLVMILVLFSLVFLSQRVSLPFYLRTFRVQIEETGLNSLREEALIIQHYTEHLLQNSELRGQELFEEVLELAEPVGNIILMDLECHSMRYKGESPFQEEIHLDWFSELVLQQITNDRLFFSYPTEEVFLNNPQGNIIYYFQIFPQHNLIIGVGEQFHLSFLRLQFYENQVNQLFRRILLLTLFISIALSLLISLVLHGQLKRQLIQPLMALENKLKLLPDYSAVHRLNLRGFSELKSISSSFMAASFVLRKNHQELEAKEELYRTLIENIPQKIFLKDTQSRFLSCNQSFAEEFDLQPQDFISKTDHDFFPKDLADKYTADDKRIMKSGETVTLVEPYMKQGRRYWAQTTKTPVLDNQGNTIGLLGIFFDITDMKEKEETINQLNRELEAKVQQRTKELEEAYKRMERLSEIDPLTGLYNRRKFKTLADQAFRLCARKEAPLCLIMVDIDFFKLYNDHNGHLMGDRALKRVAQVLEETAKRPTDFVARYGGEEFIVLLPETDMTGGEYITQALISGVKALQIPHEKSIAARVLSISAGFVCGIPQRDFNVLAFIQQADEELYKAKENGRDQIRGRDMSS